MLLLFFFQAEDGIRDLVRSRGLGDVYKRQGQGHAGGDQGRQVGCPAQSLKPLTYQTFSPHFYDIFINGRVFRGCLLYTSDAADDLLCVDLGGRRILKKKKQQNHSNTHNHPTPIKHHTSIPAR